MHSNLIQSAANAIIEARALLICAGAGMGVDSGLPDFRGDQGFWNAYPPYAKLGLSFIDLANPDWFERDPALAWGFYGHRLELYRRTTPHAGFDLLRSWGKGTELGAFVFTSNVDGQFQKAGFPAETVTEAHGSIHVMQCLKECKQDIFPADEFNIDVDPETFRARDPLPRCRNCNALARPNILMFGDGNWITSRSKEQGARLNHWLRTIPDGGLTVIECGAGSAIPTVRFFSEQMLLLKKAGTLIRINPRECDVPEGQIALKMGALAGLKIIDDAMHARA